MEAGPSAAADPHERGDVEACAGQRVEADSDVRPVGVLVDRSADRGRRQRHPIAREPAPIRAFAPAHQGGAGRAFAGVCGRPVGRIAVGVGARSAQLGTLRADRRWCRTLRPSDQRPGPRRRGVGGPRLGVGSGPRLVSPTRSARRWNKSRRSASRPGGIGIGDHGSGLVSRCGSRGRRHNRTAARSSAVSISRKPTSAATCRIMFLSNRR